MIKNTIIVLLITAGLFSCSNQPRGLNFVTLHKTDFNAQLSGIPDNKITDSLKQVHDSCMGFTFNANAMLIGRDKGFAIGTIVNKQSLQTINTIGSLQLSQSQMASQFNILTHPCYEKRVLRIPLQQLLGNKFVLHLPNVEESLNKEINSAITASVTADMQTGSWLYLDMKDALKSILDTVKSAQGLHYKSNLLDSSNMVLTSVESVTDVIFLIHTQQDLSQALQALLKSKPTISQPDYGSSLRLSYISNNQFELALNGFFPVAGEFMQGQFN